MPAPALEDDQRFAEVAAVARRAGRDARSGGAALRAPLRGLPTHGGVAGVRRPLARRPCPGASRHRSPPPARGHREPQGLARRRAGGRCCQSVDSPFLGACVDFGNNISLLEDPLETVTEARALCGDHASQGHGGAALRPTGFELSEVPLGTGLCPLAEDDRGPPGGSAGAPLCLEMITRDPLTVPYLDGRLLGRPSRSATTPAWSAVSSRRCSPRPARRPLPRIVGTRASRRWSRPRTRTCAARPRSPDSRSSSEAEAPAA